MGKALLLLMILILQIPRDLKINPFVDKFYFCAQAKTIGTICRNSIKKQKTTKYSKLVRMRSQATKNKVKRDTMSTTFLIYRKKLPRKGILEPLDNTFDYSLEWLQSVETLTRRTCQCSPGYGSFSTKLHVSSPLLPTLQNYVKGAHNESLHENPLETLWESVLQKHLQEAEWERGCKRPYWIDKNDRI